MKIKSVIILKQEELVAIQTVINMVNHLTDGEDIMISELLIDNGYRPLDDMKDVLIALREWNEVEEE